MDATHGKGAEAQPARSRAPLHPIGVVSRRTGVSPHVLRAWERRYGVVEPVRTPGGQRLYSDADVTRLGLLRQVTDGGRNISQVARLTEEELRRLVAEDFRPAAATGGQGEGAVGEDVVAPYRQRCIEAARRLDGDAVHSTLMRAVVSLRPSEFLDAVLAPLLREVGELWHEGKLGPAQEHVVTVAARRVVSWLVDAYEAPEDAPVVLVTTVSGEQHEFGALMVGVLALEEGWQVAYLGTSLPPEEVVRAARVVGATLVALSVVNRGGDGSAIDEVAKVRAALPAAVTVVVGGAGALEGRAALEGAGAVVLEGVGELRDALREQRGA